VEPILKPGKDLALPSSYRPISLLRIVGKLFETILLSRFLPEYSTDCCATSSLGSNQGRARRCSWPALLKVNKNSDERRLTGAVFLDVLKAFDTVWVKGLLYKLTVLNFPPYLVKTVSS
jgi:hypothetical protein